MKYTRALAKRRQALARVRAARGDLRASVNEVVDVYQAHPLPTLAGAAGIGGGHFGADAGSWVQAAASSRRQARFMRG